MVVIADVRSVCVAVDCRYVTVRPFVPSPETIAPAATVVGMPLNVIAPVPALYVVVAPAGRLPTDTPLRFGASVSAYVTPDAADGPALRNVSRPVTACPG